MAKAHIAFGKVSKKDNCSTSFISKIVRPYYLLLAHDPVLLLLVRRKLSSSGDKDLELVLLERLSLLLLFLSTFDFFGGEVC